MIIFNFVMIGILLIWWLVLFMIEVKEGDVDA